MVALQMGTRASSSPDVRHVDPLPSQTGLVSECLMPPPTGQCRRALGDHASLASKFQNTPRRNLKNMPSHLGCNLQRAYILSSVMVQGTYLSDSEYPMTDRFTLLITVHRHKKKTSHCFWLLLS